MECNKRGVHNDGSAIGSAIRGVATGECNRGSIIAKCDKVAIRRSAIKGVCNRGVQ